MRTYERVMLAILTLAVVLLALYMRSVSESLAVIAAPPAPAASVCVDSLCDRCDYAPGTDGLC
jgi:hypothetical protein